MQYYCVSIYSNSPLPACECDLSVDCGLRTILQLTRTLQSAVDYRPQENCAADPEDQSMLVCNRTVEPTRRTSLCLCAIELCSRPGGPILACVQ